MKKSWVIFVAALICTWYLPQRIGPQPPKDPVEGITRQDEQTYVLNAKTWSITDPSSLWVVVNKQVPIVKEYFPDDLVDVAVPKRDNINQFEQKLRRVAAAEAELLFLAAEEAGHDLQLSSAFRSHSLQAIAYEGYVDVHGQEKADTFSAQAGHSEHQTGLAIDVASGAECAIEACFGGTSAGVWIAENAHSYGFIVSYPLGKEAITGYQYEPWHLRYVGRDLARVIYEQKVTMEEALGIR